MVDCHLGAVVTERLTLKFLMRKVWTRITVMVVLGKAPSHNRPCPQCLVSQNISCL